LVGGRTDSLQTKKKNLYFKRHFLRIGAGPWSDMAETQEKDNKKRYRRRRAGGGKKTILKKPPRGSWGPFRQNRNGKR